jgi:hypothetical protein
MGPFYTTLTEEASALVILTPLVDFLLEDVEIYVQVVFTSAD